MRLALRELVRAPGRFVTATAIITLIAILLMFLGGLLDGLLRAATGALRAQTANAIVYSEASQSSFLRSRIEPDVRAEVEALDGVDAVGSLSIVQLGARVPGNGPRDLANTALWGYELAFDSVPEPPATGEVYADEVLRADGVELGDELELGPARTPVRVIGWTSDTSYSGQGGLWADVETWRQVVAANRPDVVLADGVVQSLVVTGTDDIVSRIDEITGDAAYALSIDDAIEEIRGVSEQRSTFNQILGVTVVIALVVIALFFALLTVERTALYGVLKAVGARSRTLFVGLLTQAVVVTAIATAIAAVLVTALDLAIPPGSIPLYISPGRIVLSVLLLLFAAVVGCAFSLRRILRIDPASALGS